MCLVKKFTNFLFFFWVKIGVEIMFHDVLDKKETIYHYKNDNFSKGQKSQYSKGVNSWFLSKNAKFSFTFFKQNEPRNNVSLCSR